MTASKKTKRWSIGLGIAAVIVGLVAWRVYGLVAKPGDRYARGHNAPSLSVDVVLASRRAIPRVIETSGVVETRHSVAVRAQVSGMLQKVLFNEGTEVKAGQLLFVIDPKPFEAVVAQNEGQVEQDKAKRASDRANAKRMANLVKSGYVSAQDNQNAQALVEQDTGLLAADQAKLEQARLQLSYTKITAPIAGKTGAVAYKARNLIQAGDTTPLVTINQVAPILVQFNISQSDLPELLAHRNDPGLKVTVRDPNGQTTADDGQLVFIDNTINQDAGTLSLKAQFPNTNRRLWPGELVTVDLVLGIEENVVAIPSIAVQPGQNGNYVYVVVDGKVAVRNVTVAREYAGQAVISRGLAAGDIVVAHVPRELHEGLAVSTNLLTTVATSTTSSAGAPSSAP
ncbi:MAG: efflux RND transporter periplasmic adaptor subunit [Gammaproteobacteria bacterium]